MNHPATVSMGICQAFPGAWAGPCLYSKDTVLPFSSSCQATRGPAWVPRDAACLPADHLTARPPDSEQDTDSPHCPQERGHFGACVSVSQLSKAGHIPWGPGHHAVRPQATWGACMRTKGLGGQPSSSPRRSPRQSRPLGL